MAVIFTDDKSVGGILSDLPNDFTQLLIFRRLYIDKLTAWKFCVIIGMNGFFHLRKNPASLGLACNLSVAIPIDGVVKMPLQASIFTPGKDCMNGFFFTEKILRASGSPATCRLPYQLTAS